MIFCDLLKGEFVFLLVSTSENDVVTFKVEGFDSFIADSVVASSHNNVLSLHFKVMKIIK